jgi:hypothetical protein
MRNQTRTTARRESFFASLSGVAAAYGGYPDLDSVRRSAEATAAHTRSQEEYKRLKAAYRRAGGEQAAPGYSQEAPDYPQKETVDELPPYTEPGAGSSDVHQRRAAAEARSRQARENATQENSRGQDGHDRGR